MIDFFRNKSGLTPISFGGKERFRFEQPDGRVGHAEVEMGGSVIMLSDEFPEMDIKAPTAGQNASIKIHLYVSDVDVFFNHAIANGAKVIQPLADQFYGDRSGGLSDPSGHVWYVATRQKNLNLDEMKKLCASLAK